MRLIIKKTADLEINTEYEEEAEFARNKMWSAVNPAAYLLHFWQSPFFKRFEKDAAKSLAMNDPWKFLESFKHIYPKFEPLAREYAARTAAEINDLVKLVNNLDEAGLTSEADTIDIIIEKIVKSDY